MGQVNVEQVIAAYVKLRDQKNELKRKHKEELAPFNEKMSKLEGWLLRDLQNRGTKSERTDAGTAYITTVSSATVKDRDEYLNFVREKEMWDLIENRVSKTVVQDYLEETGELIPGVNFEQTQEVRVRR